MSPFTIPNEAAAAFGDQAEVDAVDVDILVAGYAGTGVISGCAVTAQGVPDMTVAVAAGTVAVVGTSVAVAGGNLTIGAADATNGRFDLIVANNAGTLSVVAGVAGANPAFPAIPANSVVLATVYVPAADTAINSNQITDKRVIVGSYAKLDTAQTFTEDQTIAAGKTLSLAGSAFYASGSEGWWALNAKFDGTNWVRTRAANEAATIRQEGSGDLVFLTNTDAGNTVGSIITWGEKFRIEKAGLVKATRDGTGTIFLNGGTGAAPGIGLGDPVDVNLYRAAANELRTDDMFSAALDFKGSNNATIKQIGTSPEGNVTAPPGSIAQRTDATGRLYVKESGTGNTGWVVK